MSLQRLLLALVVGNSFWFYFGVLSQDNSHSIKIFIKSTTRQPLRDIQGARVRPAYGQTFEMICQTPTLAVWTKRSGIDIPSIPEGTSNSSHYVYQYWNSRTSEHHLHFNGFRKSHRGLYLCSSENMEKYVIVENRPPIDREVVLPLSYMAASIGGEAVIRGYVYGFHFGLQGVTVQWYFEGSPIDAEANTHVEESSLFNFEFSLIIKDIKEDDYGSYSLEARSMSRVSIDKTVLQSTTRVEIEGGGGSVSVQEHSRDVLVCIDFLNYQPGQSAQVTLYTKDVGLAVANSDYKPFKQQYRLDSIYYRQCGLIDIINNEIITGPVARSFQVALGNASASAGVGISSSVLTVKIIDSNVLHYSFKQKIMKTKKGGDIIRPCIVHEKGTIAFGLTVRLYPQAPPGVIPEKLETFGDSFTLSNNKREGCIRLRAVKDSFIDSTQTVHLTLVPHSSMLVYSAEPSMKIIIEPTNGARFTLYGSSRREVVEGSYGEMPKIEICFGLADVQSGLRRNAIIKLRTRAISADGLKDYVSLNTEYTFTRGALIGAQHCAQIYIRGDDLREKDEVFHVILSTTAPDTIPKRRSAVQVTIKEDNDTGDCRRLVDLENGLIKLNGTSYWSRAYYHCNEGYRNFPWGVYYRACGGNGWVGETPKCAKVCPDIEIDKGTVRYSGAQGLLLVVDTVAMIQCHPLYSLKGSAVRVCSNKGWSGQRTICEEIVCPHLPNPPNGAVTYVKVIPRSIAVYSCKRGHKTDGFDSNQRICGDDGEWSGYEPFCIDASGMSITVNVELLCVLVLYLLYL